MSPHRTPGDVIPDGDPLPQGPAKKCKGCGLEAIITTEQMYAGEKAVRVTTGRSDKSPMQMPRACTPEHRIEIGIFRRCKVPGEHLHEHCRACGLRWLTAFARPA